MQLFIILVLAIAMAFVFAAQSWACGQPECSPSPPAHHGGQHNQGQQGQPPISNNPSATANPVVNPTFNNNPTNTFTPTANGGSVDFKDVKTGDISISSEAPKLTGEEFRQHIPTPELQFPGAIQPTRSGERQWNMFPMEIDPDVRAENLKNTFPTRLTLKEAQTWLDGEDIKAVLKSPWKLNYESNFADLHQRIPKGAKYVENIYLYGGSKKVTTDGILARANEATMLSGRNAFAIQYMDSRVVPRGTTKGISFGGGQSSLVSSGKDKAYTAAGMIGWQQSELDELGYPQAIVTAWDSGCFEGEEEKEGKKIKTIKCPPPQPPTALKQEPKPETTPPKEEPKKEEATSAPTPPPTVIEKTVEKRVEVPVNPFADLPALTPVRFELNSAQIKDFQMGGVKFENTKILEEVKFKIREKVIPLMQKYPDMKLYFVGYTSGEGPKGTFHTKNKEGKRFSNSEVYNRGGLGGLRANTVGSEVVKALNLDPNKCIIVSAGWNQNQKFQLGTGELEKAFQRRVDILIGYDINTAKTLTK